MKTAFVWFVLISMTALAHGQQVPRPTKGLITEQSRFQQAAKQWLQRHEVLRVEARHALDAEAARAKVGDCPDAGSTLAQEQCLSREMAITRTNYAAFSAAMRSMLEDEYPQMPGETPVSAPGSAPLTAVQLVTEFDFIEAAAASYRKQAAQAGFDQFRGGTLAPVFELQVEQKLMRSQMEEFGFLYGEQLASH